MFYLFIFLCSVGFLYFFFFPRRFDFFSLGYFSSLLYFSPGFFGYVLVPNAGLGGVLDLRQVPLVDEAYIVMATVVLGVTGGALLYDRMIPAVTHMPAFRGLEGFPNVLLVLAISAAALLLARTGTAVFSSSKSETLEAGGALWLVLGHLTSLLLLSSWTAGRASLGAAALFLLMGNLLVGGDRTAVVLASLGLITAYLNNQDKASMSSFVSNRPGLSILIVLMLPVALLAKLAYTLLKAFGLSGIAVALENPELMLQGLQRAEPFGTQMILNTVLKDDFLLPPDYVRLIFSQLHPVPSAIGAPSNVFNELFQGKYFPDAVSYGMAYNIWAEAIAIQGSMSFLSVLAIYVLGLAFFSWTLRAPPTAIKAILMLCGSYWAFYIHRNSLASILTYERHIILIALAALFLTAALHILRAKFAPPQAE